MPRKNSTAWAVWNPVKSARLNQFNSDLDDLYALGSDRLKLYQLPGDGLQVRIGGGNWRVGDSQGTYAGGTFTVANNVTTYVMLDNAGTFQYSTVGWNSNYARIWRVVSSAGTCTIIIDKVDAVGGLLGGKGIPDMRNSPIWTPGSYANQVTVGPEFRPQSWYAWNVNIPGMDWTINWWTMVTYGNWTGLVGGTYTTQICYSNDSNDGQIYIFMRRGIDENTWGSWKQINIEKSNEMYGQSLIYNSF